MSGLKYKTRSGSSPQGKPRVYFCCHTEDFHKYFDSVSGEILEKQNCAIWYTDSEFTRDEEFFGDLKQMQLFVMPVTTNLLCTKNEALDTEFKLAIENHIPVLPLMQERGLENLFNQKCGDLQFLDKYNTDETAISYDDKLKKYLESVLIGDELANKIRAAFDAYVFLSYRKKDRKYAKELMKLIHKNDFCRDIAIWYDEFLTPGENFNDSIKEALQKSGLFVLTVTPNLVNEQNYIMTTEYPMAVEEGKPILPAELVPTDKVLLSEKYKGIPEPADAHNEAELSNALIESLKKIAIKENDNSPEHNFFIGLAYLGGVDVEVDHERARTLITDAAENGLKAAQEMLVSMYRNGQGVAMDFSLALEWQQKLANLCYSLYEENPTSETIRDVILSHMLLGDYYKEFNMFDLAETAYTDMYNAAKSYDEQIGDDVSKETYINAVNRFFLLKIAIGDFKDALKYAMEAQELANKLYPEVNWVRAINIGNAGLAYFYNQNYFDAIEKYKQSIEILEKFDFDNIDVKIIYARNCENLATAFKKVQDYEASLVWVKKAIAIISELNDSTNDSYLRDYCNFISSLSELQIISKDYDAAIESAENAYELLKAQFEKQHLVHDIIIIGYLQNLIARAYSEKSNWDAAKKHYKTALKWYSIDKETYQHDIALIYHNLGSMYIDFGDYALAHDTLLIAYGMLSKLSEKEKLFRETKNLTAYNLSISLINQKKYAEALPYMLASFETTKEMILEGHNEHLKTYEDSARWICRIYIKTGHLIKGCKFLFRAKTDIME